MTAFARAEHEAEKSAGITLVWEIRSGNHRYLEVSFRMPDECRHLEPALKSLLKNQVSRGRLEASLKINQPSSHSAPEQFHVNTALVQALSKAMMTLSDLSGVPATPDLLQLMRWPGVLTSEPSTLHAQLDTDILTGFGLALDALVKMRRREGAELADMIQSRLKEVVKILHHIRQEVPGIKAAQDAKFRRRILDLNALDLNTRPDPLRLEQELVILAQKQDVMEELDRLDTHVAEVRKILGQAEPVGRRLDFLMQELNREANTISSKAAATNTRLQTVDLKVIIEQMREQIQNIE